MLEKNKSGSYMMDLFKQRRLTHQNIAQSLVSELCIERGSWISGWLIEWTFKASCKALGCDDMVLPGSDTELNPPCITAASSKKHQNMNLNNPSGENVSINKEAWMERL